MARVQKRGLRGALVLALLGGAVSLAPPLSAECIPFIGGWECDFKNEDTQLWLNQPGWNAWSDDAIDQEIESGYQQIELYKSSTKTLGDAAIRAEMIALENRIREATAAAIANLLATAQNDPFSLKPIYLDITRCIPFWLLIDGAECPTTAELVLDIQRVRALGELEADIIRILADPNLYLGEEWGDVAADMQVIRNTMDRVESFVRRHQPADIRARLEERYASYQGLLAEAAAGNRTNLPRWEARREIGSQTTYDTMIDSMGVGEAIAAQPDREEMAEVQALSRRSVGRMQQMELSNMRGVLANQTWQKMGESMLNRGHMIALDMEDEGFSTAVDESEARLMRLPVLGVSRPVRGDETPISPFQ